MRKIRKKPEPVADEAVVAETPVEIVAESVAEAVVEQAKTEKPKVVTAEPEVTVVVAAPPAVPAPNTSEHGNGGVYRSTGDGRRIKLR